MKEHLVIFFILDVFKLKVINVRPFNLIGPISTSVSTCLWGYTSRDSSARASAFCGRSAAFAAHCQGSPC